MQTLLVLEESEMFETSESHRQYDWMNHTLQIRYPTAYFICTTLFCQQEYCEGTPSTSPDNFENSPHVSVYAKKAGNL